MCPGLFRGFFYLISIYSAIPAISKSSKSVTYVIGTLNTVPKQAQTIVLPLLSSMPTPIALTLIRINVAKLVITVAVARGRRYDGRIA